MLVAGARLERVVVGWAAWIACWRVSSPPLGGGGLGVVRVSCWCVLLGLAGLAGWGAGKF